MRSTLNLIHMEKKTSTWIFPTVKIFVNIGYYLTLLGLVIFLVVFSLKLTDVYRNVQRPGQTPAFVDVSTEWSVPQTNLGTKTLSERGAELLRQKETAVLRVPVRSTLGIASTAAGAIELLSVVLLFYLLKRIFDTMGVAAPFHPANVRRISLMGLLLIGQDLSNSASSLLIHKLAYPYIETAQLQVQRSINSGIAGSVDDAVEGFADGSHGRPLRAISVSSDDSVNGWFLGLILLALAQVYRRGIELQAENELTV